MAPALGQKRGFPQAMRFLGSSPRAHRPAEVCYLELSAHAQQQVLWLYVPVDHVLGVAVHQRLRQGCDVSVFVEQARVQSQGSEPGFRSRVQW